jgi:hypothetical protein|eukprot:COSAG06_NODE_14_length_35011_cov_20.984132_7_plen_80_part_00
MRHPRSVVLSLSQVYAGRSEPLFSIILHAISKSSHKSKYDLSRPTLPERARKRSYKRGVEPLVMLPHISRHSRQLCTSC